MRLLLKQLEFRLFLVLFQLKKATNDAVEQLFVTLAND